MKVTLRAAVLLHTRLFESVNIDGHAEDLRKRLTKCVKANMPVDPAVLASLDVEGELEACEAKLNRLLASIDEYEGEYTDTEGQRLQARIWHNYLRIQRIPVVTEADEGLQRKLLSEAKRLCDAASGAQ
ncbi:hypothetical protein J6590_085715 [Homalodisca vitripennis]|nr:hypothetical protein J6590_085715 [Homalodisca vitripennis]